MRDSSNMHGPCLAAPPSLQHHLIQSRPRLASGDPWKRSLEFGARWWLSLLGLLNGVPRDGSRPEKRSQHVLCVLLITRVHFSCNAQCGHHCVWEASGTWPVLPLLGPQTLAIAPVGPR